MKSSALCLREIIVVLCQFLLAAPGTDCATNPAAENGITCNAGYDLTADSTCVLKSTPTPPTQIAMPRHALVIANSYSESPLQLKWTHNDANRIVAVLRELGFTVTQYQDLNDTDMEARFKAFQNRVKSDRGIALLYFSGHGMYVRNKNFLIPQGFDHVEANEADDEADLLHLLNKNAFDLDYAGERLSKLGSLPIIVIDACRTTTPPRGQKNMFGYPEGRFFDNGRAGLLLDRNVEGVFWAYATKERTAALTDSNQCKDWSPFTCHLVKQLEDPESKGVGLASLFKKVRTAVKKDTNKEQEPVYEDDIEHVDADEVVLRPLIRPISCPADKLLPPNIREDQLVFGGSRSLMCSATYLALLASEASYQDSRAEAQQYLDKQSRSFSRHMQVTKHESTYTVVEANLHHMVVVAFRGTEDLTDWMSNLDVRAFGDGLHGNVHTGFWKRAGLANGAKEAILAALKEHKYVVVTGHSLGGAVASLMTMKVLEHEVADAEWRQALVCITFGQPHVSDKVFSEHIHKAYNKHFYAFVNEGDIVPRAMLLQPKMIKALVEHLKGNKLLGKYAAKAKTWVKTAVEGVLRSYLGAMGMAGVTDMAANAVVEGALELANWWASNRVVMEYEPFGTYLFISEGEISDYDMSKRQQRRAATMVMKHDDVPKELAGFMDWLLNHQIKQYAAVLENLRAEDLKA